MSDAPGESVGTSLERLYAAQRRRRERWFLTAGATVVGLGLASLHWSGLLAGGALVGLCWPTLRRAVVAGLAFAVVVLAAAVVQFSLAGVLGKYLAMGPILWVSVVAPVVGCPLGATVRGLLPDAPPEAGE